MKLGENDIKLYLGSAEVAKVYLGTTQVYPSEEPTPVTRQWVSYTAGTPINTITDNVYGIRISLNDLGGLFDTGSNFSVEFTPQSAQNAFAVVLDSSNATYITDGSDETPIDYDFESDFEVIFSDYGFNGDYTLNDMISEDFGLSDGTLLCNMELYM